MRRLLHVIVAALLCLLSATAHADLSELELAHEKNLAALKEKLGTHLEKLGATYTESLKALQEEHQKIGNLEATLAVRKEIKRFEPKPLGKDEQAALHPTISALRAQFDAALQRLQTVTRAS